MTKLRGLLAEARRRGVLRNSSSLLADRMVRLSLGVLVNVVLARTLGPGEFGLLATAISVAFLFVPLSTLGCERIAVRELARGTVSEGEILKSLGLARLIGGSSGWLLAIVATLVVVEPEHKGTGLLVAWIAAGNVFLAFDVIDWSFQSRGNFGPTTLARLGAFLIGAVIKVSLAIGGGGLLAIAATIMLETLLAALFQVTVWRCNGGSWPTTQFDPKLLRRLLRAGLPLLAAEVAIWLFQRLDLLLLTQTAGAAAGGVYSVAQRLGQVGYFLPVLGIQMLSPAMARAPSRAEALLLVQRAMNGMVVIGIIVSLALSLAGEFLVQMMFGSAYASASGLLVVLAWNNLFVFMGCAHSLYLINRGEQTLSLWLTWITAALSVTLNLLLIPRYAAQGAAWASVLTYACSTVFAVACFDQSRPLLWINLRALLSPAAYLWNGWRAWRALPAQNQKNPS